MASIQPQHRVRRVTSIKVGRLFGLFDHDIRISDSGEAEAPSVLILYGDNGTGKTTILRLVYHLLSKESNRGHRTFLARVPFSSLEVNLTDDYRVSATRDRDAAVGSYTITISQGNTRLCRAPVSVDEKLSVNDKNRPAAELRSFQEMMDLLGQMDVSFFFLADDRKSQDYPILELPDEEGSLSAQTLEFAFAHGHAALAHAGGRKNRPLEDTLERLHKWVRDEVLKGAHVGEANTSTVYADIAKRIANTQRAESPEQPGTQSLASSLAAIEGRSKPFAQLGFISHLRLMDIVAALNRSQLATQRLIAEVVAPYVEGLTARLDALQEIQDLISLFLKSTNSFLHRKSVSYGLAEGLAITSGNGQRLKPRQLSSGEGQLLLLLANVLMARRQATIFLIDEPEISLNVKWQRNLVDTLLGLVRGTPVQFMLATHSLELLARHRQYVHRLDSGESEDA